MSSPAAPRCSDAARERADPMVGTAAPARRWLLVEHPGPWAIDALAGSGIAAPVRQRLVAAAASASARILLVRRPGRAAVRPSARAWAVVDHSLEVGPRWGTWQGDDDLLAAADALGAAAIAADALGAAAIGAAALSAAAPGDGPVTGDGDPAPILLVCAHGRHDTCCAVRGRPVAAELARHWPQATWECSHVGGDRFAANLVLLPDGAYYGNLDPASAVDVVRGHLDGRVCPAHLRGISGESPVVQAAVVAAHERWGPAGSRDVRGSSWQQLRPGAWSVELVGSGPVPGRMIATVTRSRRAPARLTCRAVADSAVPTYDVVDLRRS